MTKNSKYKRVVLKLTGEEIAKQTGVSRSTVYRIIKMK